LLDHRAELTEDDLDTLTLAALASLDGALLSTLTLALATEDVLLESELRGLALVEVLEGNLDTVNEVLALSGTLRTTAASSSAEESSSTAEELREEILGVHTAHSSSRSSAGKALLAVLVVDLALLLAAKWRTVSNEQRGKKT
jgi:hypothetical protein